MRDASLIFSAAQAVTATAVSDNKFNLYAARDLGAGGANPTLRLQASVNTLFVTADAATLQVQVTGCDTESGTYVVMAESKAIAVAALVAGARLFDIDLPRPVPGQALPKFLQLNYVVGTGSFSAGKIDAALVTDRMDQYAYPPGVVIAN